MQSTVFPRIFSDHPRLDVSIDSGVEGQSIYSTIYEYMLSKIKAHYYKLKSSVRAIHHVISCFFLLF